MTTILPKALAKTVGFGKKSLIVVSVKRPSPSSALNAKANMIPHVLLNHCQITVQTRGMWCDPPNDKYQHIRCKCLCLA